jgi:two-component system LytT family response regulator
MEILLVEDEALSAAYCKEILCNAGHEVQVATNSLMGYQIILNTHLDLVICDINLPEMTGFELMEVVSTKLGPSQAPPFIFLTSRSDVNGFKEGLRLGAVDYITKPVESEELLRRISLRAEARNGYSSAMGSHSTDRILIPQNDGLHFVKFEDIIKCKAERAYCRFYFTDGTVHLVSKPMKEYEDLLLQNGFFKLHKSFIANLQGIDRLVRGKKSYVVFTDGSTSPISDIKKNELISKIEGPK